MCLQSQLQTSPPTPQKSYPKFRNHIFKKRPKKDLKIVPRGPGGGGPNFVFFSEFLLFFFRGPCKNLEPYDNPFWGFSNGGNNKKTRKQEIPLAPMGVLAPGSAHARPSARPPIDTSGNFSGTRVCRVTFKISPNPSKKLLKKPKKSPPRGPGGGAGSNFFFTQIFIIFFRSPCKIWEPYDNPFWKNSDGGGEKEEEKKSMIIVVPSSDRLTA